MMNAARSTSSAQATLAEVEDCLGTLERLVSEPDLLASLPEPTRKALLIAAGRLSRPVRHERERVTKAIRRYRRKIEQQEDLELRKTTQIRDARSVTSELKSLTGVATTRSLDDPADPREPARRLNHAQNCYICKCDYTELHRFYDSMCPDCAELNYRKRTQSADLQGRVALVTGARIKIGFHTALMLLRAGAKVIGTTRFPHDAAERFSREPDYEQWKGRLALYGLDLRFCPSVELFAEHLRQTLPGLDFLINNAAQTVHRPAGFFSHLRPREELPLEQLPERQRRLLLDDDHLVRQLHVSAGSRQLALDQGEHAPGMIAAGHDLAMASMPKVLDFGSDPEQIHFPPGRFDADGQQLDLRPNNSWRLKAADVPTPELIEVHLVNAIAPFILVSRLRPLMASTAPRDKHIVNVSAMEGVFARRTKTDKHPHTNMAKASLNMLTRTSAKDFARDGIHMNSVDTGWVTDEDPHPHAERKVREYDFSPPLDAIDGAARVCDPIFTGFLSGSHVFGQFFKDYRASEW
ncbi:MAG TPA: SDR family oxidoreductase [Polyangiaceae bacterium]|nr:SDR family oxidoreductase [Polyangiaceae bacterium]